jgi:hypothetical protein
MRNVYDKVNAKGTQMVLSQKLEAVPFWGIYIHKTCQCV